MRRLIVAAAVLGLSGCTLGSHDAKPKPPRPVPLVAASCERALVKLDAEAAGALEPVEGKQREIDDRREILDVPWSKVRKALRALKVAAGRLKAFDSAHPQTYLAPSVYYQWRGLRDAYSAALDVYKQRLKKFRPFEREYNALVKEEKTLWKAVNSVEKDYDRKLDGCLGPRPRIARAEAGRIRRLEGRLAHIVDEVSGRDVLVSCATVHEWTFREREAKGRGDLLGYVVEGGRTVHLAPSICYALHRVSYLSWKPDLSCLSRSHDLDAPVCPPRASELIRAAITLAHEAQHFAGVRSEKRAECFGLQRAALVAQRLGVAPSVSDQIAWYAWKFSEAPKSYWSHECRDGGKLDLDSSSTSFP